MNMDTPRSALSAAFAAQLRAERAAQQLSQAALAKAAGMSLMTIRRLEENSREIDTDQLDKLCRALGVGITDFVTRAMHRQDAAADPAPQREARGS